ncbi:archease [Amycolatopsis thermophila]|uniref:SHS2 domain-containing protein n=1 Tax=Amycolatopsis thermophila TaxID=206084 RepID=A0ABU0F074_9PSEU|nr:archease [Amycolatopsis thermophila]MDQ0380969.1 SHS2 domain-containing protein [Amycolatopsis thermophila]
MTAHGIGSGTRSPAGRRARPVHAGDLRIEAWGTTRELCVAEAVRALVDSFVPPGRPVATRVVSFEVTGADDQVTAAALARVITALRRLGVVPVDTEVTGTPTGLRLRCDMADAAAIRPRGALPKAVTAGSVRCGRKAGSWWCTARIDV